MTQEIIKRAKWLYAYNGGAITLEECAGKAFKEYEHCSDIVQAYTMFGITRDILLEDIIKKVKKEF